MKNLNDTFGRPLRDLRLSVTDRCNFRCSYCMPPEKLGYKYRFTPRKDMLSIEELKRLAQICIGLGAKKIRLTGGEPLLRADLTQLVEQLTSLDDCPEVALTTNGVLLPRYAAGLRQAGLQRITVSLDTLDESKFKLVSGTQRSAREVLDGIEAASRAGFKDIKINAVIKKDTSASEVVELARYFRGTNHILRLIEFMDVGNLNAWNRKEVMTAEEIRALISEHFPLEPIEPNYRGEVAQRYRYCDGAGEVGIIASVSAPFCGDCTRARVTVDGQFVTCLFSSYGVPLKPLLRSDATDDEIARAIQGVWTNRKDRYSELRNEKLAQTEAVGKVKFKIEMYKLGG